MSSALHRGRRHRRDAAELGGGRSTARRRRLDARFDRRRRHQQVASVPSGVEPPTLEISDAGEAAVFTGCNRGGASVEVSDASLTFGPLRLTRMACGDDATVVETTVTSVIDGTVDYSINGDVLAVARNRAGAGVPRGLGRQARERIADLRGPLRPRWGPSVPRRASRNRFAAFTIRNSTHAISRKFTTAVRNRPLEALSRRSLPEPIVHTIASKLGLPKIAAIQRHDDALDQGVHHRGERQGQHQPHRDLDQVALHGEFLELLGRRVPPCGSADASLGVPAMPAAMVLGREPRAEREQATGGAGHEVGPFPLSSRRTPCRRPFPPESRPDRTKAESCMSARSWNPVAVGPGQSVVTVTPRYLELVVEREPQRQHVGLGRSIGRGHGRGAERTHRAQQEHADPIGARACPASTRVQVRSWPRR